ncbi:MAG: hypothetical protein H0V16_02470 [Burkholderiaceae bacterium]|nr:hypothetical protein [Burkholderiaceae bacterium]
MPRTRKPRITPEEFDKLPAGGLIGVADTAAVCRVSESTAWRWIARGILPGTIEGTGKLNVGQVRRRLAWQGGKE